MPNPITRRHFLHALGAFSASGLPGTGRAAPAAGGSIVVPFSAGSLFDTIARRLADLHRDAHGASLIVENVPGAGGLLAGAQVLKRPRDGRAMLLGNSGLICATPLLTPGPLEFDPRTDLVPICTLASSPFLLFAGRDFPASNLKELQQFAATRAEPVSYATSGAGTANHLAGETLLRRLGIKGLHVPYRNVQQGYVDVAERTVSLAVFPWSSSASLVKAGRLKPLALLSDRALPAAPQAQTTADQGFGTFDLKGWFGLFAAKGVPDEAIVEHARRLQSFIRDRSFGEFLLENGQEPAFRDPPTARAFVDSEIERYRGLITGLGLA